MRFVVHDTDALFDAKVQRVVRNHGPAALGLYWAIVETVCREERGIDHDELESLSYLIGLEMEDAEQFVYTMEACGLLVETDGVIISRRAMREVENYRAISEKKRAAANKRWSAKKQG